VYFSNAVKVDGCGNGMKDAMRPGIKQTCKLWTMLVIMKSKSKGDHKKEHGGVFKVYIIMTDHTIARSSSPKTYHPY